MTNVAIISPNKHAYSETFIQAHRNIATEVFYYYGGAIPSYLDGEGYIGPIFTVKKRIQRFIKKKFSNQMLTDHEEAFGKSLLRNHIDIVFAEYGTTGAKVVNTCRYLKIPLVVIFHGFDASKYTILNTFKEEYKRLFEYSKSIIAVSNPIRKKLIELGCPSEKITVTPCAPNDIFLKIKPTFKEPQSFIAIGRFVNKKAPYYTILAFKRVIEKYPDAKLYFAGEGELFETCKNLVTHFNLEKNIQLLGRITPEEYSKYLSRVAGYIQHSITALDGDTEGTPVSLLEASAAGLPVIATRHAGISDVIIENKTGFLVNEHDVLGMADAIIRTIESPERCKVLGMAGKKRIQQNFSMERHLKTIEKLLMQ